MVPRTVHRSLRGRGVACGLRRPRCFPRLGQKDRRSGRHLRHRAHHCGRHRLGDAFVPRRPHHGRAGPPGSGHLPGGAAPRHRCGGGRCVSRAVQARGLSWGAQGSRRRGRGHGRYLQLFLRVVLHDVLAAGLEHRGAALGLPRWRHGLRHRPVVRAVCRAPRRGPGPLLRRPRDPRRLRCRSGDGSGLRRRFRRHGR